MATKKRQQTINKRNRERAIEEKRTLKRQAKEEKREAIKNGELEKPDWLGPPNEQLGDDEGAAAAPPPEPSAWDGDPGRRAGGARDGRGVRAGSQRPGDGVQRHDSRAADRGGDRRHPSRTADEPAVAADDHPLAWMTIHWHGRRIPAAMDGTASVQAAVEPGASFDYEFTVPDAGTFWYHTHVNETEQLERGLYGPLVVRGAGEPALDADRVLMLDDLKLDADGHLSPFGEDHELHEGREGDVRLVNGAQEPELELAAGQVERWRIVNAANTRFMRLSIGGRPFSIIASDGGLLEAPVE